jgi:hypothetical protein
MKHSFAYDTHNPGANLLEEAWGDVVTRDPEWGNALVDGSLSRLSRPFTSRRDRADGRYLPVYETEIDLAYQRAEARVVAEVCPPAIGAMENLTNYTIGKGFTFTVGRDETADLPLEAMQPLIDAAQRAINETLDTIKFHGGLDREIHAITREDGETFLPLKMTRSGGVTVQRLWPDQVTQPMNTRQLEDWLGCGDEYPSSWTFGVHTQEGIPETPLGYHVLYNESGSDWDYIPESRMVHLKANVPRSAKRGVSDFYAVTRLFRQDDKMEHNLATTAAIQAAIAWIRQYPQGVTQSGAQGLVGANKTGSLTIQGQYGNQSRDATRYPAGTILDIANGMSYLAGPTGMAQANPNLLLIQAMIKRTMGVRWQMPEYMISGDASNADYSSTKEAGGPFVKAREADQVFYGSAFVELLWKALRMLHEVGRFAQFGLSWQRFEALLKITVNYPPVATKDPQAAATTQQILVGMGAMSRRTASEQNGLDYDQERENMTKDGDPAPAGATPGADPNAAPAASGEHVGLGMRQVQNINKLTDQILAAFKGGAMDEKTTRMRLSALKWPEDKIDLMLDDDPENDPLSEAIEGEVVVGKRVASDVPTLPTRDQLAAQVAKRAGEIMEAMALAVAGKNLKRANKLGKELDTLYEHAQQAAATLGYIGLFDPSLSGKPPRTAKQDPAVITEAELMECGGKGGTPGPCEGLHAPKAGKTKSTKAAPAAAPKASSADADMQAKFAAYQQQQFQQFLASPVKPVPAKVAAATPSAKPAAKPKVAKPKPPKGPAKDAPHPAPVQSPMEKMKDNFERQNSRLRTRDDVKGEETHLFASRKTADAKAGISHEAGKSAINAYTSNDHYKSANASLRGGGDITKVPPSPQMAHLNTLAQQPLSKPTLVYRGIPKDVFEKHYAHLGEGSEMKGQGFGSASLSPNVARSFSDGGGKEDYVMEIKAKTGLAVSDMSEYPEEHEIIQAHGTRYRLLGIDRGSQIGNGTGTVVRMEEI